MSQSVEGPFKLYSVEELLKLNQPPWLVGGLIERGSFVVIYGRSGSGKSFVALDLALSIARGKKWHGADVSKSNVVYVVGEGTTGIGKRVKAWMLHHAESDVPGAFFLLKAPRLLKAEDVDAVLEAINKSEAKPSLIVLDTLARCFIGGDENSAKDMGSFVEGCQRLQRETEATVMVVHHSGKKSETERGSGALRGAADAMIKVSRKDETRITITNDKQKDEEESHARTFNLARINVAGGLEVPLYSCVLDAGGQPGSASDTTPKWQKALDALKQLGKATPLQWRTLLSEILGDEVDEKALARLRALLVKRGLVMRTDDPGYVYQAVGAAQVASKTPLEVAS